MKRITMIAIFLVIALAAWGQDVGGGIQQPPGGGGSATPAFSAITSGTNTTAAMVVGSGASITPTGTGVITSTLHEFAAVASTGGTTANLLVSYDGTTGNVTTSAIASLGSVGFASATATSGNPLYVIDSGATTCIADNTVTVGNLLGVGTTTAGRCKDLGTAQGNGVPSNVQIVGKALTGGAAGSSITVQTVGAGHFGTLVVAASTNTSICSNNSCTQITGTRIEQCGPGGEDGNGVAIPAATYTTKFRCINNTGSTWTITGITCAADNSGSSTANFADSSANALLTGAITLGTANTLTAGTQSATTTLASGNWVTGTIVADGTSKVINCVMTYSF